MQQKPAIVEGVREGEILAGKYRIERILGAGGMGVVVAAHHLQLDERVAIKLMLPEVVANQEALARFGREARAAVKIKSEHVARVSDVGSLPNGAPYMVMEYLEGIDLGDWLEQRGRLAIDQAVEFVLQACEAIAEAHALGIVHRDLKPRNLFVVRRADGLLSVKVLDFGISKATNLTGSGSDLGMTKTSAVMGSPLYMSPEQMLASRDADARSDIWSLGVILYELLTAALPFAADTMPELVAKILGTPPLVLRAQRPDAPPALESIINRCLEKDRGKRYQTVGELAVALVEFAPKRAKSSVDRIRGVMSAAGLSGTALNVPSSDPPPAPPGAGTAAAWGTTAAKPRSSGKVFGIAALAVLATAAIVFGVMRRHAAASDPAEPVTSAATSTREETPTPVKATAEATEATAKAPEPNPVVAPVPATASAPAPAAETAAVPAEEPMINNAAPGAIPKRPPITARPGHRPTPVAAAAPMASPPAAAPPTPPPPPAAPAPPPKPASTGWGGRL